MVTWSRLREVQRCSLPNPTRIDDVKEKGSYVINT